MLSNDDDDVADVAGKDIENPELMARVDDVTESLQTFDFNSNAAVTDQCSIEGDVSLNAGNIRVLHKGV